MQVHMKCYWETFISDFSFGKSRAWHHALVVGALVVFILGMTACEANKPGFPIAAARNEALLEKDGAILAKVRVPAKLFCQLDDVYALLDVSPGAAIGMLRVEVIAPNGVVAFAGTVERHAIHGIKQHDEDERVMLWRQGSFHVRTPTGERHQEGFYTFRLSARLANDPDGTFRPFSSDLRLIRFIKRQ